MADARYGGKFRDPATGEELGLLLAPGAAGYTRHLSNPYAAKGAQGDHKYGDLTEWSTIAFDNWQGGRGQDKAEEKTQFCDSYHVETRIKNQITLGPLPQFAVDTNPEYTPGSVADYAACHTSTITAAYDTRWVYWIDDVDRGAQSFLTPIGANGLSMTSVEIKVVQFEVVDIQIDLYADSGGEPTGSSLGQATIAGADASGRCTATFASAIAVTGNTRYHIVISTPAATGTSYFIGGSPRNTYDDGYVLSDPTGTGVWSVAHNASNPDPDLWCHIAYEKETLAQSFTTQAAGLSCTKAKLFLRKIGNPGTFTVSLCSDNAGSPGTVLKADTFTGADLAEAGDWYELSWAAEALAGSTLYWLTVAPPAAVDDRNSVVYWGGDSGAGYGSGSGKHRVAAGSWLALSADLYFQVQTNELDGAPIALARYNGKRYLAAGDTVYEYNTSTSVWDTSDQVSTKTLTALATWGGYLWAARGAGHVLRRYNGTAWADVSGKYATLLRAGGGELDITGGAAGQEHTIDITGDGSTWLSSVIEVGAGDYEITGMAWYQQMLVVSTATRLWGVAADTTETVYVLLDWSTEEDVDNGRGMAVWGRDGALYIPLRHGLYRWNGDTMRAVGPEQGTGLPAARAGRVRALLGIGNWLCAAIDAGTSGTSSILAYGGMGDWHELARADQAGDRIRALFYETIGTLPRLWYGLGNTMRSLILPDYTDNPYQYTGYEFNGSGELITSWMGAELSQVVKDLHQVVIQGEGFSSSQAVDVWYEVERSGQWTWLGTVDNGPQQTLKFRGADFAAKTLDAGSTRSIIELASGSTTTDMEVGNWVRINGEVSQVASIPDSDTFALESALSALPMLGDRVYASQPAGREFRLKVVLRTTSKSATPKITAIVVRYQNNVLDRWVFSLQVRVEDNLEDRGGAAYPQTAAGLRAALDGWAQRVTPFVWVDPDGNEWTVKVASAAEGGFAAQTRGVEEGHYRSLYSINLVEV